MTTSASCRCPKTNHAVAVESDTTTTPAAYPRAAARRRGMAPGHASEVDLHPELDDAVRRDAEVLRGRAGVARDEGEERLAPAEHLAVAGRQERLAAEEVARALGHVGDAVVRARRCP